MYYVNYYQKKKFPRKWMIEFGAFVVLATSTWLVICKSAIPKNETSFIIKIAQERIPKYAKECISFYDLLEKSISAKIGKRNYPKAKTNLTLVGAYAYENYSVVTLEAEGWYGQKVYCHYFDVNWNEVSFPVESVVFPDYAVHCCKHPKAFYMGITKNEKEEIILKVPVLDRSVDKPIYNLSVCLAPIYGNESKWLLLTELVEHYKLQGVQHLYVYVKDVDDYSRLLIDDYEKSGEIEVIYFKKEQDRLGMDWHIVGVVDCLQRSRHHSRYAIFTDLDERILAQGNETLAEYIMKVMPGMPDIGMLQLQMTWVLRTKKPPDIYEGEITLKNHLPTFVFHNTSAVGPPGHTAKCVLDPRRVVFMWIHDVLLYFPGYRRFRAPPNKALIRHYRELYDNFGKPWLPTIMSRLRAVEKFGNFTATYYPKDLMWKLYGNVKKRLSWVYKT